MGWEIHNAKTAFGKFADEWDRLNARLYDSHPFADSRFIGALLDHFGDGSELLCVHRTGDGLSGGLILRSSGLWRYSSFRPAQRQALVVLLEDARLLTTLLTALPKLAWTIELYAVDPRYAPDLSSVTLPLIVEAQARTIGIDLANGFPAYWEKRPKKLAANIARYFRRTEAEFGTDRVTRLTDAAEMDAGVDRFGAMESAGWKGQAGTAVSRDNEQGAFYLDVLRRFALTNQAAVYELHIGDRLASSRLVIANDHLLIFLKTTYDESLARLAPGRLLLYRVIEEQYALSTRNAIEFYTNATSDQREWATFACTVQNIQIFRGALNAAVFSLLRAWRRNLRSIRNRVPESDAPSSNVSQCKSIEGLQAYDLGEFAAKDNFQASTGWFELLEKNVYPADAGVRYYFTAEKKTPRVILPVRLTTRGAVKSIESLSNYYTALYAPLLSHEGDPLDLQDLLAVATHDHGGAHVMRFSPMDPDSATYKGLLSGLRANDWIPFQFFCFGNWFLRVEGSWEDYLRKRSANLRSALKRRCKQFAAAGGTLEIVTAVGESEQGIAAFQEVYSASWKKPEPYPDFVPSLIRQLAAMGMLRLGIARLNGRTIAAQLWIVDQQKASIYKVAYHGDFASYSPGTILTAHLLQHVIDDDCVREVDFLIGDDKYKRMWMSDRRERWGIVAYNPGTIIGFALLTREVVGRACKSVATRIKGAVSPTGAIGGYLAASKRALARITGQSRAG
ncbi:MAG TPA: GNAT family N-acetyltransferase [Accumulibacter sp.]|uniref:GNAT family N-acetyltransferase n=1 Tax=Accumulibacter sp. TaxID=2053492 RepID=UPI002C57FB60|nr:GNAT family N-acetyltransferase [Accumulibacter sp.]HRF73005.1 GNAT family N-acetyltransferase [Accumulibacter sp.]